MRRSDSPYEIKGNFVDGTFVEISDPSEQSKAIKITDTNSSESGAAVLFYSTSENADTVTDRCCSFSNSTNKDPRTSEINTGRRDGSYALFTRMEDIEAGSSDMVMLF